VVTFFLSRTFSCLTALYVTC